MPGLEDQPFVEPVVLGDPITDPPDHTSHRAWRGEFDWITNPPHEFGPALLASPKNRYQPLC
jgi:hypothetical protein